MDRKIVLSLIRRAISTKNPIYKHYRTHHHGDITLCIIPQEGNTEANPDNEWVIGAAMCSPRDQLKKREGRDIAATRCLICEQPFHTVVIAPRVELFETIKESLRDNTIEFFDVDGTKLCPGWFNKFPKRYEAYQEKLFQEIPELSR